MKYWRHLLPLILLILPTIVYAQANENIIPKKFTAYSLTDSISALSYVTEGEIVDFKISNFRRSQEQTYKGPPMVTFFRGGLDEDGEPVEVIARTRLKKELKRPLLLFSKSKNGYNIIQIEDDMASAPSGSVRFMNLTDIKQELFVGIGEDAEVKKKIEPAGVASYQITDDDIGNLRIRIARLTDNDAEMIKDMRIFPEMVNRYIYFIFQPDLKKPRIKMKMLVEKTAKPSPLKP
jgi:hypothetical protein